MSHLTDWVSGKLQRPADCKGLFFRYTEVNYATKTGWAHRTEIKALKRMSCSGCKQCEPMKDHLREFPEELEVGSGIGVGGIVQLVWQEDGKGPEDLYSDWHLVLQPHHSEDPNVIPHPTLLAYSHE